MGSATPTYTQRGVGRCPRCGKVRFLSRADAKTAKRILHPDDHMTAYMCGRYWHYGHNHRWRDLLPDDLIWTPLPRRAVAQMHQMARLTIGAPA